MEFSPNDHQLNSLFRIFEQIQEIKCLALNAESPVASGNKSGYLNLIDNQIGFLEKNLPLETNNLSTVIFNKFSHIIKMIKSNKSSPKTIISLIDNQQHPLFSDIYYLINKHSHKTVNDILGYSPDNPEKAKEIFEVLEVNSILGDFLEGVLLFVYGFYQSSVLILYRSFDIYISNIYTREVNGNANNLHQKIEQLNSNNVISNSNKDKFLSTKHLRNFNIHQRDSDLDSTSVISTLTLFVSIVKDTLTSN